jgi:signal transduction histidine kinase
VQNRRIQEASRLKSEFVANMSHELRTPLNSIVGFTELIIDKRFGPMPERYAEFVQIMHVSAQHLLQLINDILDLAKVESGRIDFQPEPVDLSAVIGEATAIITGLAAKRKIALRVEIDQSLGRVYLDPMRLKQVLYNYLSNAVKFTRRGAIGSASRWKTPASASSPKRSTSCSSSSSSSTRAPPRSSRARVSGWH